MNRLEVRREAFEIRTDIGLSEDERVERLEALRPMWMEAHGKPGKGPEDPLEFRDEVTIQKCEVCHE
jgi:hypothetical protein